MLLKNKKFKNEQLIESLKLSSTDNFEIIYIGLPERKNNMFTKKPDFIRCRFMKFVEKLKQIFLLHFEKRGKMIYAAVEVVNG